MLRAAAALLLCASRLPRGDAADTLPAGEKLEAGSGLVSESGSAQLNLQKSDGNLVLYAEPGQTVLWSAKGAGGNPGDRLQMQGDGNLVLYSSGGTALWSAGTTGSGATNAVLHGNCSFALYTSTGEEVWSTGTRCVAPTPPAPTPAPAPAPPPSPGDSLSFLVLGDWGGSSDSKPTTTGQKDNSKGMATVANQLGDTQFVMAVGDNFYESGIQGSDSSKRFETTFENVYVQPELQCPWYVVAGNHDHGAKGVVGNVTAQIAYSKDSSRWNFPSLWYTFSKSAGGKTTQVVYIDTVVISGMSYEDEATGRFVEGEAHPLQALAPTQLQWLDDTLAASTADYLWVSGHYPIYSQCKHGPTSELQSDVLPLMRKYNASGYISGHDHCLGHFNAGPKDGAMQFVLSGAGKDNSYTASNVDNKANAGVLKFRMDGSERQGTDAGFASLTATATSTVVKYYASDGTLLYTADPILPRNV